MSAWDLRELFAKANEEKSGDQLAELAARSKTESKQSAASPCPVERYCVGSQLPLWPRHILLPDYRSFAGCSIGRSDAGQRHCGLLLSPFVILPVGKGGVDILLLALLGAPAKQNHEPLPVLPEIHPVSGAEISALSLQKRNGVHQRERLRRVIAVRLGELNRERNTTAITNQMALAPPIGRIGTSLLPPKTALIEPPSTTASDQSIRPLRASQSSRTK